MCMFFLLIFFSFFFLESVDDQYYLSALVYLCSIVLTANIQVILRYLRYARLIPVAMDRISKRPVN